jgi:hypothetical protein
VVSWTLRTLEELRYAVTKPVRVRPAEQCAEGEGLRCQGSDALPEVDRKCW